MKTLSEHILESFKENKEDVQQTSSKKSRERRNNCRKQFY
jgi:hypothetical protein